MESKDAVSMRISKVFHNVLDKLNEPRSVFSSVFLVILSHLIASKPEHFTNSLTNICMFIVLDLSGLKVVKMCMSLCHDFFPFCFVQHFFEHCFDLIQSHCAAPDIVQLQAQPNHTPSALAAHIQSRQ
jgi:hypothetical protein